MAARPSSTQVSRALKAAGHRPRHGEKMHGRGGYQASQDGDVVRVAHRWGPEGDHLSDDERTNETAELLAAYRETLTDAGYTCEVQHGAVYVTKGKGKKMREPQTDREALATFHAYRDHTDCADCQNGPCETYIALEESVRAAANRGLSPYVVRQDDGILRGAWDQNTADFFARRSGGAIIKAPSIVKRVTLLEHKETLADVENAWVSEENGERWLNIRAYTDAGTCMVYRLPEEQARWLNVCVKTAMNPIMRELND